MKHNMFEAVKAIVILAVLCHELVHSKNQNRNVTNKVLKKTNIDTMAS